MQKNITSLWEIHYTDGCTLASLDCVPAAPDRWILPRGGILTVSRQQEATLTRWSLHLEGTEGIDCIEFPILPVEGTPASLCLPWQLGVKIPDPLDFLEHDTVHERWCWMGAERRHGQLAADYPGMASMQFLALEYPEKGKCFHLEIQDGEAHYKGFGLYSDNTLRVRNYPVNGTGTLPYDILTGWLDGTWEASAAHYRQWAVKQEWCGQGKISERQDIPQWVKDSTLWYWNWCDWEQRGNPEKILPVLQRLKTLTGSTPNLHWYGWNNQRSDTDYPAYRLDTQAKTRMDNALQAFHAEGIRVLPYLNGRLWNIDTPAWRDRGAARYACRFGKSAEGEPYRYYIEPYMERPFAVMCPATDFWRSTLKEKCHELLEYGMDGAYLDQISSSFAVRCHAKEHGHPVNGNYYARGYQTLMHQLRTELRGRFPQAAFTSESVTECYIGSFDLFLAYQGSCSPLPTFGPEALSIPLFSYVYHGYIPLYGTGTHINQGTHFFHGQAVDIGNGVLPTLHGYFAEEIGKYPEEERFFLESCRFHIRHKAFLQNATRLPTPAMQCGTTPVADCGVTLDFPAVLATAWENNGEKHLVLVNHSPDAQTAEFADGTEYRLAPRSLRLI